LRLTPCMQHSGISEELVKVSHMIKCPRCGFEFNLIYARAFACQGCRYSVMGCDAVRCPRCDLEFKLDKTGLASNKPSSKVLSEYMSKIMADYFRDFGESPTR